MGKVFLFVIMVTLGLAGLLFMANSQDQTKQPVAAIPTVQPITPTAQQNTQQQAQTQQQQVPPTQSVASVAAQKSTDTAKLAEQFLNEMASKSAVIKTSKGDITLSFYTESAINTVYNFVQKAKAGFYNNLTFHRVEDWVVQGGDPLGNGTGGGNIPVEFNDKPFVTGSLGMASRGDGKVQNDAQFFITKKESSWLNGQYTNFGIVKKGMDVVQKLEIGDKILGITIE